MCQGHDFIVQSSFRNNVKPKFRRRGRLRSTIIQGLRFTAEGGCATWPIATLKLLWRGASEGCEVVPFKALGRYLHFAEGPRVAQRSAQEKFADGDNGGA
jgi:hypothetical protein